VINAGGVDDAGVSSKRFAVQACGRLVQRRVVENLGQRALVEVAADDWNGVNRRHGRNAQAAQRCDQAAARRVL